MNEVSYKMPYIIWYCLYEMSRIGKSMETEHTLVIAKRWKQGEMESDC